jgi:EmrB/QacA subfamily drug resistance transporter
LSAAEKSIRFRSRRGRRILWATVLGSGLAGLDATVVNVALPAIGRTLGGGVAALQWVVNGYTLTLASLLLVGGALGDRYGRRRMFVIGVTWFTLASVACGLARTATMLILARVVQGIGGALLAPGSLAILGATFDEEERGAAIGAWSGLGAVALAVGPFVGGWLVQAHSWRLVFFINVPIALAVLVLARAIPETRDPGASGPVDLLGAALAVAGLAGITWAFIEAPAAARIALPVIVAVGGASALLGFFVVEARRPAPMLDLRLFRSSQFAAANAETLIVYAALGGALFLLPLTLQRAAGYSPLAAGAALLPMTAMVLLLSRRMGRLAERVGPRAPMTVGPIVAAAGLLLLTRVPSHPGYLDGVLPGAVTLGLGLAITVAPLTTTVLAAAPRERAGIGSAINNCIARTGGLLAVATLPAAIGLSGKLDPATVAAAHPRGMIACAVTCLVGSAVGFFGIRNAPKAVPRPIPPACPLDAPALTE